MREREKVRNFDFVKELEREGERENAELHENCFVKEKKWRLKNSLPVFDHEKDKKNDITGKIG